jgi:hypothetical protein
VSKVKSPGEKKRLSYERDRRNTYGENQKSSRKNIPRGKQRGHRDERRAARQSLSSARGAPDDIAADAAQSVTIERSRAKRLKSFRKSPDTPLRDAIQRRSTMRARRDGRKLRGKMKPELEK